MFDLLDAIPLSIVQRGCSRKMCPFYAPPNLHNKYLSLRNKAIGSDVPCWYGGGGSDGKVPMGSEEGLKGGVGRGTGVSILETLGGVMERI